MIIMVTGHRYLTKEQSGKVFDYFTSALGKYKEEYGDELKCMSGMALGVDTLFARAAKLLKIPYIAAVPFSGQSGWKREKGKAIKTIHGDTLLKKWKWVKLYHKAWPTQHRDMYFYLLGEAEEVVYVDNIKDYAMPGVKPGVYHPSKFQKRNEYMADHSDYAIAVFDGRPGGTYNCVKYMKRIGLDYKIIDPR